MGWALFKADVRQAARAWQVAPGLPILTLCVFVVGFLLGGNLWSIPLSFAFMILQAGFFGTQRIWYLRAFHGATLPRDEIWPLTRAYLGRFVVLGFLAMVAIVPFGIFFGVIAAIVGAEDPSDLAWFFPFIFVWGFALDLALTFVVPALSYTTRSVDQALRIGFSMVRRLWLTAKWYALAPGVVWFAFGWLNLANSSLATVAWVVGASGGAMLALLFKGAIAAYYLRQYPDTGPTGSAYFERGQVAA